MSNLNPFRQCCHDLSVGVMPHWETWKSLNGVEKQFLFDMMLMLNDFPIVLGYLEHMGEGEIGPQEQTRATIVLQMARKGYVFPGNITQHEWMLFDQLSGSQGKEGNVFPYMLLGKTALAHQRPDIFEWFPQSLHYQPHPHLRQLVWDGLDKLKTTKNPEMIVACIRFLKTMGVTTTHLKEQAKDTYPVYERHLLQKSISSSSSPSPKPKMM